MEEIGSANKAKLGYSGMVERAIGRKAMQNSDTGYDALGNIAVINPEGLTSKQAKGLAECIMSINRNVTTVVAKSGPVKGKYRTRDMKYVAGKRTFISKYKENSCMFHFDVRKTFFSNRLAYERARIARLSLHDKTAMVMFAGMGPFAIEMARENKKANILAIELNPYAYRQMCKNVVLNKAKNVKPILGDVSKLYMKYKNFADRIVMPLPKLSTDFLDEASAVARNRCTVHLYSFVDIEGGTEKLVKTIKEHARKKHYKARILFKRIVRNYSATEIEIVIDYRITK